MLNAATDVGLMLFVGKCRAYVAHRMEVVSLYIGFVHGLHHLVEFCLALKAHNLKCIIEVVENNHHLI